MNENVTRAFTLLATDILDLFHKVLASDVGINRKPMAKGENTLKNSRLAQTAEIQTDIPFYHLILNDYIDAIENGRRIKAPLVPISDLRDWARRKGIPSDNKSLEIIQYLIWRDGIDGRPVMKTFFKMLDKEWNATYSKQLFEAILHNLTQYFNQNGRNNFK